MNKIIYLTLEQAIETHKNTIKYSGGGTFETINLGQLESILEHLKNDDYYPTFADKLARLFFAVCKFHCFADGNKRLAITLSAQFLLFNGYLGVAKTFFEDTENISANVAASKIDEELSNKIIHSILDGTYAFNEELKLEIYNAIK